MTVKRFIHEINYEGGEMSEVDAVPEFCGSELYVLAADYDALNSQLGVLKEEYRVAYAALLKHSEEVTADAAELARQLQTDRAGLHVKDCDIWWERRDACPFYIRGLMVKVEGAFILDKEYVYTVEGLKNFGVKIK